MVHVRVRLLIRRRRKHVACPQRRGTEPAQRVGGPAAQRLLRSEAAPHRHVGPQARRRRAELQDVALPQVQGRRAVEHPAAARPVQQDGPVGAGDGHDGRLEHAQGQAAAQGLDPRRALAVADQPVGQAQRRAVEGAGGTDADMRPARPPQVLHERERPGRHHLDHRGTSRNRTRVPGASSAGSARPESQSTASVRPSSRHPPGDSRG